MVEFVAAYGIDSNEVCYFGETLIKEFWEKIIYFEQIFDR